MSLHGVVVPPRTTTEGAEILRDETCVVRIRAFPNSVNLMQLLQHLRHSRSSGTILIDLTQGGIGSIRFREESQIEF